MEAAARLCDGRYMSLCQEKDIFGTKHKILFLCQNDICLYVFMFLGMLHYQKYDSTKLILSWN